MAVDTTPRSKEIARLEAHTFVASEESWIICKICGLGLGRSVHTQGSREGPEETKEAPGSHIAYYGDDNPEVFE